MAAKRPVDWRLAGQKADATRVANILRERYESNPSKTAIRTWVVHRLAAVGPTLVADLWGGGCSADEMVAAGLAVLSIDDGRSFAEYGISGPRGRRSMELLGDQGGYRTAWGSVTQNLGDCDAAWLDFMGHLAPETEAALRACRGMRAVAITLMPERMAGVRGLSLTTWEAMYRGAIERLSGLRVRIVRKYRRNHGQWVLVFLALAPGKADMRHLDPRRKEASRLRHERERADPAFVERRRLELAALASDPAYLEARHAYMRAYHERPEVKERRRLYHASEEYRAKKRAYRSSPEGMEAARRYKSQPEYKEKQRLYAAAARARAKAARGELA